MPTFLRLRFPFGRYHANPWARHVNEGAVEIPPAPWRLLRALYAVWCTRLPGLDEGAVLGLLAELAAPPTFHVPRHTIAHTRHYYPDSRNGTDRTLDSFATFDPDAELVAHWPQDLVPTHRVALERLAASLPYFGRADSLCAADVTEQWYPTDHETWVPVDVAEAVEHGAVSTSVLAPELPLQVDTLIARPVDVRRGGLLFPRGSRLIGYQRTRELAAPTRRPATGTRSPVVAVRFDVLQAALPPATDALVYTDLLRQAALSKLDADPADRGRTVLGGRSADDQPLRDDHSHAHYLPLVTDRQLTGLVVWVPGGLPEHELEKLLRVRRLRSSWEKDRRLDVRVAGYGRLDEVGSGWDRPGRVWRSVTPFVPARYPKRSDSPAAYLDREIRRDLEHRSLPPPAAVTAVDTMSTRQFVLHRPSRRSSRAHRPASAVEIRWDGPVSGPVTLGHLSHFGLGLFAPTTTE